MDKSWWCFEFIFVRDRCFKTKKKQLKLSGNFNWFHKFLKKKSIFFCEVSCQQLNSLHHHGGLIYQNHRFLNSYNKFMREILCEIIIESKIISIYHFAQKKSYEKREKKANLRLRRVFIAISVIVVASSFSTLLALLNRDW